MFDTVQIVADAFADHLALGYVRVFGARDPESAATIRALAQLSIERISGSDALYHDVRHTMHVTLVGQAILRGRIMVEKVTPSDWLHFTVATLLHDIGYLRGICPGDQPGRYVTDDKGGIVDAPRGASDAFLAPWHVDRGKMFVRHRCAMIPGLDCDRLCDAIELTRFPIPDDREHTATGTEGGLVRAADLIGQLADPDHLKKLGALYHEFYETGAAEALGYANPADLIEQYPRFFWSKVEPYIDIAIAHLARSVEGRLWTAQLYANVFVEEHARHRPGPERGHNLA